MISFLLGCSPKKKIKIFSYKELQNEDMHPMRKKLISKTKTRDIKEVYVLFRFLVYKKIEMVVNSYGMKYISIKDSRTCHQLFEVRKYEYTKYILIIKTVEKIY